MMDLIKGLALIVSGVNNLVFVYLVLKSKGLIK